MNNKQKTNLHTRLYGIFGRSLTLDELNVLVNMVEFADDNGYWDWGDVDEGEWAAYEALIEGGE